MELLFLGKYFEESDLLFFILAIWLVIEYHTLLVVLGLLIGRVIYFWDILIKLGRLLEILERLRVH